MNKKTLYERIVKLAVIFQKEVDKDLVVAYVEMLHGYEENDLINAFNKISRSNKFFPKVAEIIEVIEPQVNKEDEAQILANNIIETVLRYGRYQTDRINKKLSPEERYALMAIGGIEAICNIQIEQLGTVRAQLRNSCRAAIVKNKIDMQQNKRIENRRGKKELDFKEYLN